MSSDECTIPFLSNRIENLKLNVSHLKELCSNNSGDREELLKSIESTEENINFLTDISKQLAEELKNAHLLRLKSVVAEDLLKLLYVGSLFDSGLSSDSVVDDAKRTLDTGDFESVSMLARLLISRPLDSSISHTKALKLCFEHATSWLDNSNQPVKPKAHFTYAGIRQVLNKVMASQAFQIPDDDVAPAWEKRDADEQDVSGIINAFKKKREKKIRQIEKIEKEKGENKERGLLQSKPKLEAEIKELKEIHAAAEKGLIKEESRDTNQSVSDEVIRDLLHLMYYGTLFYSWFSSDVDDDNPRQQFEEKDLKAIANLSRLISSRQSDSKLSHKHSLEQCVKHAKLWLAKSDQQIEGMGNITYKSVTIKLVDIQKSEYFSKKLKKKAPKKVPALQHSSARSPVAIQETIREGFANTSFTYNPNTCEGHFSDGIASFMVDLESMKTDPNVEHHRLLYTVEHMHLLKCKLVDERGKRIFYEKFDWTLVSFLDKLKKENQHPVVRETIQPRIGKDPEISYVPEIFRDWVRSLIRLILFLHSQDLHTMRFTTKNVVMKEHTVTKKMVLKLYKLRIIPVKDAASDCSQDWDCVLGIFNFIFGGYELPNDFKDLWRKLTQRRSNPLLLNHFSILSSEEKKNFLSGTRDWYNEVPVDSRIGYCLQIHIGDWQKALKDGKLEKIIGTVDPFGISAVHFMRILRNFVYHSGMNTTDQKAKEKYIDCVMTWYLGVQILELQSELQRIVKVRARRSLLSYIEYSLLKLY